MRVKYKLKTTLSGTQDSFRLIDERVVNGCAVANILLTKSQKIIHVDTQGILARWTEKIIESLDFQGIEQHKITQYNTNREGHNSNGVQEALSSNLSTRTTRKRLKFNDFERFSFCLDQNRCVIAMNGFSLHKGRQSAIILLISDKTIDCYRPLEPSAEAYGMYSQAQLNTVLSETKDGLTRIFGDSLCDVLLYGSCARGEQDEESDIDVMALVNLPKTALSQYRRMVSDLSSSIDLRRDVLLSIKLQDMDSFQRYGNTLPYFQNVRREGVRVV